MINSDTSETIKKEEILSLISLKGSHLVMEQLKTLLESKTGKMEEELNYLKDRLDKANIRLKKKNGLIEELEPSVTQTTNMLNEYRLERDTLAKEIKKLEGIEEKTLQLAKRKALIESRTDTVRKLTEKQKKLQQKFNASLSKKEKIVEELTENSERLNTLNEHITALRDKKEMIVSTIPEYSGPSELRVKKGEAEKDIANYTTKINQIEKQLTAITKKTLPLEKQAEKKLTEKDTLLTEQDVLQEQLVELEAIANREMLSAEVSDLKKHKSLLFKDIKNKELDIKRITSEIPETEKSIEKEKDFTNTAGPRLEELMEQKGEIDDIENVLRTINLNIAVNKKFQEIVNSVTSHLGPLNESLGSLTGDYKAAINRIIKIAKKGAR